MTEIQTLLLNNQTKILIVVDMQVGFKTEANEHIYNNINKINFNDYEYVFATKFQNIRDKNSNYFDLLHYDFMTTDMDTKILLPKKIKYIEVKKSQYALPKNTLNKILSIYKTSDKKEVHIVGTDYDSCVLAIGFQLFDAGLQPRFYYDLIGSHSSDTIKLNNLKKIYVKNFGKNCFINER